MSIIGSNILAGASGQAAGGYEIEQSLRFDGTADLVLTTPATTESINAFTMSCWVKVLHGSDQTQFMGRKGAPNNVNNVWLTHNALGGQGIGSYMYTSSINGRGVLNTNAKYRDYSAWMHVHYSVDSSAGNTQKLYVNGVDVTANTDTISGVLTFDFSSTYPFQIGNASSSKFYLAEYHFISGSRPDYTNFGEEDEFGVWRPIEYTGSYGNNGMYLKFDPTATNGIGHDHSGTGNHLTATGFTTSGTGTDVMSDTPTTNWCTLNPLEKPGGTAPVYENGNLTLRNSTNYFFAHGVGTFGLNSGKWYFETSGDTSIYVQIGFLDSSQITSMTGGGGISGANISWHYQSNGIIRGLSSTYQDTGLTAASTAGDIMGLAIDFDAGEALWYVNGTQVGSTVDFSSYLSSSRIWYPVVAVTNEGTDITNVNFGQRDFAYTPPTGFKALNTANLPAPTVKDGSANFNTVTYTGTGAALSITGVGFQPDFIWFKRRSHAENHWLQDAVRGVTKGLYSNLTDAEATRTDQLQSFDSDGFSLGVDAAGFTNISTRTYVAWNWLAGGSGSSNTDGSITSTVSANPTAGFSIVQFDGTGANGSIGHGLGVAPSFIVAKSKTHSDNWFVYHSAIGANGYIMLNQTAAADSPNSSVWQNVSPTGTVFYASTGGYNDSGETIIAYCFAEVESYSRFGSYVGNGSSDGPFVYTGMAPAFILVKQSSGGENWLIFDTTRKTYNEIDTTLSPNVSSAEVTNSTNEYDILSNGFKARNSSAGVNQNGQTYIFAAFSENPFGGSGVSPATAR